MSNSSNFAVKGRPLRSIVVAGASFLATVYFALVASGAHNFDHVRDGRDRILMISLTLLCLLATAILTRRAWFASHVILNISNVGFEDRRMSSQLIEWKSVTSLKTEGPRRYLISMRVDLDEKIQSDDDFRASLRFRYRLLRALGKKSLHVDLRGLSAPAGEVERQMRSHRLAAHNAGTLGHPLADSEPIDATADLLRGLKGKRPYFTFALLAVLLAIFIVQTYLASSANPSSRDLVMTGGLLRTLVMDGQWWRFLTGPLLHGNAFHLGMNALALLFGGYVLERVIGWQWYGTIFVIAALTGAFASFVWHTGNIVSVGASGGITGLFAAAAILAFHYPDGALRQYMLMISIRILIPTLLPMAHGVNRTMPVDIAAHVGGAIGGAAVGAWLLSTWAQDKDRPDTNFIPISLMSLYVFGALVGFGFSGRFRSLVLSFDPNLPASFDTQVARSEQLIKEYPHDPRIRYARASALYQEDHDQDARKILEDLLADRTMLTEAPAVEGPTRALLGTIYSASGNRTLAEQTVAPECASQRASIQDMVRDLCPHH